MTRLLRELLPGDIGVVETQQDFGSLLPDEANYFSGASAKRVKEATTVRACARLLLDVEGIREHPLVPGENGGPTWPTSFVGSMTHCHGYRAAVIGHSQRYLAVGIDVEPAVPLSASAAVAILLPNDSSRVRHPLWTTILFSAKEAAFKAWSAAGSVGLHPLDLEVRLSTSGRFLATAPSGTTTIRQLEGRWGNCYRHVATAVVIPSEPLSELIVRRRSAVGRSDLQISPNH